MIAAIVFIKMSLGTGLFAQTPEGAAWPASAGPSPGAEATRPAVAHGDDPEPVKKQRRFVFGFFPSIMMGLSPLPSAGPALFFGGRLSRSWALGYQIALETGLAYRYTLGMLTHRHMITALHAFGRGDRGLAGVGAGVAVLAISPVVEAEGRIGVRLGKQRHHAVALQVRLGWDVGHREQAPLPMFGITYGRLVW